MKHSERKGSGSVMDTSKYTTIKVELPDETYEGLKEFLDEKGITFDELIEGFYRWVVAEPDAAISWLTESKENV